MESTVGRTFLVLVCRRGMERLGRDGGALVHLEDVLEVGGGGVEVGGPAIEA